MGNSISKRYLCCGAKLLHLVKKLRIKPAADISEALVCFTSDGHRVPNYFWRKDWSQEEGFRQQPRYRGYEEARILGGDGSLRAVETTIRNGLDAINNLYAILDGDYEAELESAPELKSEARRRNLDLVDVRLSEELVAWRKEQHTQGRILPGKGRGLRRTSDEVIQLLGAEQWPAPLLTNNVLFGTGWTNMLIGAYDSRTLYSNYCCDMGFFYEHGFHKIFPEFEEAISSCASDPKARNTPLGAERRDAVEMGLTYIRGKADQEAKHVAKLTRKTAKLDRKTAHMICFCEASLAGMAYEAMGRGFDPAAMFDDMVFSSPGTDVVDVGSDINNSEIMNSFLNTADITETGNVTEDALRKVYDAYAATGARCLTERWFEPLTNMNSLLYIWHILNDRHHYLRRIVLGWSKVRRDEDKQGQREADFDEVFDEHYHTTGFSRPLKTGCDGRERCDAVENLLLKAGKNKQDFLRQMWSCLVERPLNYARAGVVDPDAEEDIIQDLSVTLAQAYHDGLIYEQQWMVAHACHHAWQVNYLMEAAMFGSLLDDESLSGTLDRAN
ncbi:hypothetical protein VP1G_02677 [Cytospora mali]|uniref:Uncharacterized protein n=1 Tax=Cytospora mali TaxID=578113 RepID=A0A194UUP1_CYTMA|nr:hypothetical protein VP1G_02677 [Valsa mali var. pyri (nom. inval.)]